LPRERALSRKTLVGRRMWKCAIAFRRQLRLRDVHGHLGRQGLRRGQTRRGLNYRGAHDRVGNMNRWQENRRHRRDHHRNRRDHHRSRRDHHRNRRRRNGRRGNGRSRGNRNRG
jgi:hypothetical protein